MNAVLEIHILQNFAPSNLNRDDTGSPKDAFFGGVRRARISSQSFKRAMRTYFREQQLLKPDELAVRTKRVVDALTERLEEMGRDLSEANARVVAALGGMGLKADEDKSQYLLFLGEREIARIAQLIHERWDELNVAEAEGGKKGKDAKKAAKAAIPADLSKQLRGLLDGGKAVDLALFGRMLADLPERNADAAAQVAHALGTSRAEREFDFYTAVDDLKPEDTAGADMLGTVEFVSATYYRYANVDLEQLTKNLQGDTDLALRGLEAFLRASIFAAPSGKQNTFAAHNLPSFVAFTVRRNASPRSLANAFETPVQPLGRQGLIEGSVQALVKEWQQLDGKFGQGGQTAYLATVSVPEGIPGAQEAPNVDALVEAALREARAALGV
ncbi:CRISPR system Cascade subunit CasC [Deinobacterium chartae]|uniref:CRISPR system Cascade subunit CasC n=1 Tax=Deinobacterium chartae TaxID=521158 RepID=A0A841I6G9_9DEIO|nr:type I-E CRISPR-associated protein Cas7/Cse4/CasC [Deinobacterium chartae]MBB6100010.1 CRISPR system Cascade subunit CasC [Deinobacterium chartae]